jgi:hypothetical protein
VNAHQLQGNPTPPLRAAKAPAAIGEPLDRRGANSAQGTVTELQEDKRAEQRAAKNEATFFWAVALVVAIDCVVFPRLEHWGGPVIIGVIEFIGIIFLADRCKVDSVAPFFNKVARALGRSRNQQTH